MSQHQALHQRCYPGKHAPKFKALLNLDKVITFGSVEGRYDVCIEDTGKDEMVKTLKKLYEPVGLEKETVR